MLEGEATGVWNGKKDRDGGSFARICDNWRATWPPRGGWWPFLFCRAGSLLPAVPITVYLIPGSGSMLAVTAYYRPLSAPITTPLSSLRFYVGGVMI